MLLRQILERPFPVGQTCSPHNALARACEAGGGVALVEHNHDNDTAQLHCAPDRVGDGSNTPVLPPRDKGIP